MAVYLREEETAQKRINKHEQRGKKMKGYKGFNKGFICRGKQYAENTVFEEDSAVICRNGMHFCENPFDVLDYYGFVNDNGELNEFAEVESLDEAYSDDNKKYVTKKLKIGAKLGIKGLVDAFVNFTLSKTEKEKTATNTGDRSAATNTGNQSAATNTGYRSAATNTGNQSAATAEGKDSFAIATGIESKARGKLGCYIAVAEWVCEDNQWILKGFKSHKVDGKTIKEDTFYTLKNGKFVKAD